MAGRRPARSVATMHPTTKRSDMLHRNPARRALCAWAALGLAALALAAPAALAQPDRDADPTGTADPAPTQPNGGDECVGGKMPDGTLCTVVTAERESAPAAVPRSATTEITPPGYGLSPQAGSDYDKKREIADQRLDKKLEEAERRAVCAGYKTQDPSAYQESSGTLVDVVTGLTLSEAESRMRGYEQAYVAAGGQFERGEISLAALDGVYDVYADGMRTYARIFKTEHGVWPGAICLLLDR
jgi:hypothetical protein